MSGNGSTQDSNMPYPDCDCSHCKRAQRELDDARRIYPVCDEHGYSGIPCPECAKEGWLEDHKEDRVIDFGGYFDGNDDL